jgi:hypoxanthine-guanine phosphoribosyltransferase
MLVKDQVKILFDSKKQLTVKDIADSTQVSRRMIQKVLKTFVESGFLTKVGTPPKVFYIRNTQSAKVVKSKIDITPEQSEYLKNNFVVISPDGTRTDGEMGFVLWCEQRNEPFEKTLKEYFNTVKKYDAYKTNGLIMGDHKMNDTFDKVYLDHTLYVDFYSIERFGKTKLGQLLLYAKNSQDKKIVKEIVTIIKTRIEKLIKEKNISAVAYIPPTVPRQIQFMSELAKGLKLTVPTIELIKIKTEVVVPQKTLSKLSDRIMNADSTIFTSENRKYKTVLLIDDAVGSGATLNQTAKKLKENGIADIVLGLSVTGSANGFDIINEA